MSGERPHHRTAVFASAALLLSLATLPWLASRAAVGDVKQSNCVVQWSEKDAEELAATLHRMHELANKGDIEAVKRLLIGDDVLVTFELAADNQTAVPLRSKKEIDNFLDTIVKTAADQNGSFYLDMPKMHTRATSTWGVCTEECTVRYRSAGGAERIDKLYGTNIGVKTPEGWKFIQWHMSVASPSRVGRTGDTPPSSPGHHADGSHR
jgi:SnoaL-like domain